MAIRAKDIYQGRKKSRSRAGVAITVALAVLAVVILLFYGLRHYAVYDESGNATIVLPFTHKEQKESPTPSVQASPSSNPSESPAESTAPSPSATPETSPTPSEPVG